MDEVHLTIRRNKRGGETKLVITNKSLISIPDTVYKLTHIQILNLSFNKINLLEEPLAKLTNLKILICTNNNVQNLEPFIQNMALENLDLSENPLTPQFAPLFEQENQSQPKLAEILKQCFDQKKEITFVQPDWFEQPRVPKLSIHSRRDNNDEQLQREKQKVIQLIQQINILNQQNTHTPNTFSDIQISTNDVQIKHKIAQGTILNLGGFSIVHFGIYRGTPVAVKKIFDPNITEELMEEFHTELSMLRNLKHPKITLLMGVIQQPPNLAIVTEFVPNGSLYQLLHQSDKKLHKDQKLDIAQQVASVLNFLHLSSIAHRDIKSHNILLDNFNQVKLCDFGLAKSFADLNKGSRRFCGTPCYMSPEQLQRRNQSPKSDVFSFGTLLWEIMSNQIPFEGLDQQDITNKVVKNEQLSSINSSLDFIIQSCRDQNPENRPSFEKLISMLRDVK